MHRGTNIQALNVTQEGFRSEIDYRSLSRTIGNTSRHAQTFPLNDPEKKIIQGEGLSVIENQGCSTFQLCFE